MKNNQVKQRLLVLLLAVVLLIGIAVPAVSAAGTAEIAFGQVFSKGGERVTVPVTIKNNPGIASFRFRVAYDPAALTYTSAAKGEAMTGGTLSAAYQTKDEELAITWFDVKNISGDGVIFNLVFEVSDTAKDRYPLTVSYLPEDIVNASWQQVDMIVTNGWVEAGLDYIVKFVDEDGTELSKQTYQYGEKVLAPASPTKAPDNTYTYAFAGWDKEVVNCAGEAIYTATYKSQYIDYTVVFKNWDGATLSTETYHWGDKIVAPNDPTREKDDYYIYTFAGWDSEVADCAGNAVFQAVFTKEHYHTYSEQITAPNCTEKGYTTHTCRCGDTYVDTYVDELGHSFTKYESDKNATCTADGTETAKCDRCDVTHTRNEKDSATGHTHEAVVTAPTCTEKGYTTHTCHCGDSYVDTYVDALGHTHEAVVTAPTCTEKGYTTHTCHCGDTYVDTYVEELGHDEIAHEGKTPTCTTIGWEAYVTCSRCDYTTYEEITADGHNYTKKVTAPTYTKKGYTTYTCACGDTYKADYTKAKGLPTPSVKVANDAKTGKPTVSWKAVSEASSYTVYRATSEKGKYTKLGSTTKTSYVDKTAAVDKTYYYKVKAVCAEDSSVNSKDSKVASILVKCAAPKVTLSQNKKGQSVLKWGKVDGAKKYEVYYATSKNGTYKKLTSTSKTTYTHTKTSAGKEYFYKVKTVGSSSAATGAYSDPVRAVVKLTAPKLTVTTKNGQNTIKWKKISGATKYELQCSVNGGSYKTITTTTKLSYTHKGLAGGNKYTYRIRAKSSVSDATSSYSATKAVAIKCAAPGSVTVSLNGKQKPVIKWGKVAGAAKYKVYYATSKSGKYKAVATVTGTSYTHTGAPAAKDCYYKVVAVDKNGTQGEFSAVKKITTKCAAPANVKVTKNTKKQPVVSWSKTDGAKKYEVYVATSKNGKYKKVTTTNKTSYTYTKAKSGTTYYFKVTAYGKSTASKSAYSAIVKN